MPTAVLIDGRTLQSSCESGPRAGYDGYKRRNGSKAHMAVDTLGHLIAVTISPANEQERAQVDALCQQATEMMTILKWMAPSMRRLLNLSIGRAACKKRDSKKAGRSRLAAKKDIDKNTSGGNENKIHPPAHLQKSKKHEQPHSRF